MKRVLYYFATNFKRVVCYFEEGCVIFYLNVLVCFYNYLRYRGFLGEITRKSKGDGYVIDGLVEENEEELSCRITELPIGTWTQVNKHMICIVKRVVWYFEEGGVLL